jgi:transcriptional regulator with XRE-family HTH domain
MQTRQAYAPHNLRLGARVKALRKAHPDPITAIAAACQISGQTLFHIEQGRGCRSESLAHIAQFFGVSLDYLMGFTDEKARRPEAEAEATPGRHPKRRPQAAAVGVPD